MNKKASPVFIYDDQEIQYKFNENHPFNQDRLTMTVDLLRKAGALPDSALWAPRSATDSELLRVHSPAYIEAVKALSCSVPEAALGPRSSTLRTRHRGHALFRRDA